MAEFIGKITRISLNGKEYHPFKPYGGLSAEMLEQLMFTCIEHEKYEECTKIKQRMEELGHDPDMNNLSKPIVHFTGSFNITDT